MQLTSGNEFSLSYLDKTLHIHTHNINGMIREMAIT